MNLNNVLSQIIKKHKIPTTSTEAFLEAISKLYTSHSSVLLGIKELLEKNSMNASSFFINCPNCGSHTMLSSQDCHICGNALIETDNSNIKIDEVKEDVKQNEKDVKPSSKKEEIIEDDDFNFEDEVEEKSKKESKKTNTKKDTKKTSKKVEEKQKEEVIEDDDFNFDDEVEEKPKKEEPKKSAKKEEVEEASSDWEDDFDLGEDSNADDDDFDFDI